MILRFKDVRRAVDRAREVSDAYRGIAQVSDATCKSIDELQRVVDQYLGRKVLLRELKIKADESRVVAGYLAMIDGSYQIYITAGMTEPDKRFAFCKELFHVILDEPDARSMELYDHVEEVVTTFPVEESKPNLPACWEKLAEIAAMEFLFPFKDRVQCVASGAALDLANLAARRGLPIYLIEQYLSDSRMQYFHKVTPLAE